jgi:hypothetical protein
MQSEQNAKRSSKKNMGLQTGYNVRRFVCAANMAVCVVESFVAPPRMPP